MKAYEFPTKVTPEGRLEVPEEILNSIARNRSMRAIVLVSESPDGEDAEWVRMATEQFMAGYDAEDAIYDKTCDRI